MKSSSDISPELAAHLAGPALTIAWCWMLRRRDGFTLGFTTHVENLPVISKLDNVAPPPGFAVGTVICKSTTGFLATDIAQTDSLSQNNLDVTAILDDASITENDLRAGLWRNAQLEVAIVNYRDLSMGSDTLFIGSIGNISAGDISYKAEQRGITQILEGSMPGIVSEQCNARLGDRRCGVNLGPYLRAGTLATTTSDRLFTDPLRTEPDGWWTKGLVTMTSGASVGMTIEIKQSLATGSFEIVDEFFFGIQPGDTYSMSPGCNKLLRLADGSFGGDCKVKYHNVIRFRGFHVPGQEKIQQYGGQDGVN